MLLGVGSLLPYNFFITPEVFWQRRYHTEENLVLNITGNSTAPITYNWMQSFWENFLALVMGLTLSKIQNQRFSRLKLDGSSIKRSFVAKAADLGPNSRFLMIYLCQRGPQMCGQFRPRAIPHSLDGDHSAHVLCQPHFGEVLLHYIHYRLYRHVRQYSPFYCPSHPQLVNNQIVG